MGCQSCLRRQHSGDVVDVLYVINALIMGGRCKAADLICLLRIAMPTSSSCLTKLGLCVSSEWAPLHGMKAMQGGELLLFMIHFRLLALIVAQQAGTCNDS